MAYNEVTTSKTWTFDAAHQLVGHFGKCANLHGHTYKLEVGLRGIPNTTPGASDEGFVMDFYDLKKVVGEMIVDKMDHAFLAKGDEPILPVLQASGKKVVILGFRSTVENMVRYICWKLMREKIPVEYVTMWETPTGKATAYAKDIDVSSGPNYNKIAECDLG